MHTRLKKSLALFLALLTALSVLSVNALAADGNEAGDPVAETEDPAPKINGFSGDGDNWYYYVDGEIDTSRSGVIQGTVNDISGQWYVIDGRVRLDYTGLSNFADADGRWWYMTNGRADSSYSGITKNDYGWWYVRNGQVDFSHNGVDQNEYGWWYILGGQVQFGYTGVANYANDYGWWYIENGKVNFNKNSVEQNNYGWWYVLGGKVDFSYTGVANYANAYGWWYIQNGQVDFGKAGIEPNNNGWWRVSGGKVDFSCNSVEQNSYGWWYILGGQVQFGYTGIADYANAYGWWYIKNGQVDFGYTGLASNSYGTWYTKSGQVDFGYTGLYNGSQIKNGKRVRVYQNPSQYYQIQDSQITLSGGGYNLDTDYEGLKTAWVKKALNLGSYVGNNACIYNSTVKSAVSSFQSSHGLSATGITDLATWKALGYSEDDWYTLGAYVSPIQVNADSTRSDCIEAMISRAYDYLGDPYVIGASGPPGTGVDCSGLVMQALYAAGIDMSPINPVRHASPGYEYESRNMWNSDKMMHVSYSDRQRGDLIFYCNSSGVVVHVAIYLGNDQIIDSWPNQVRTHSVTLSGYSVKGVARPFV